MRYLILGFMAMFVATSTVAKEFLMGDVLMTIGDSEEALRPKLEEKYQLIEIRSHVYEVVSKEDVDVHHGIVQFRDGKADWASRDVGAFEGEGVRELGKALLGAIAADIYGENAKISISLDTNPRYEVNTITFELPGRTVMMYVAGKGELADVTIEEIILAQSTPAVASAEKEAQP